jgi:Ras-related protein Rab-6A
VFDVTNQVSFDEVPEWISRLRAISPNAIVAVVANKTDLSESRVVTFDDGESQATSCGASLYEEASALTGQGIDAIFSRLAQAYKAPSEETSNTEVSLALDERGTGNQGCCNRVNWRGN